MEFTVREQKNTGKWMRLIACVMLAGFYGLQPIMAIGEEIYIVPSRASGPHAKVSSDLKQRLSSSLPVKYGVQVLSPAEQKNIPLTIGSNDYIITVGTQAFSDVLTKSPKARIVATLIPEQAYKTLLRKHGRVDGTTSAVFLEQSIQRNLDLVRVALPNKTAGVLLGSGSGRLYAQLEAAQREQGIQLYLKKLKPKENLISALDQVLMKSNVLIAFADPEVSNRNTAQHLLLTTYRHGIPVIAYSRAYVKAGALMAVYSTPEQYARQVAEMVRKNIKLNKKHLPGPQYPRYFSVEINKSVAHSLGIKLKPKNIIESRLRTVGLNSNE